MRKLNGQFECEMHSFVKELYTHTQAHAHTYKRKQGTLCVLFSLLRIQLCVGRNNDSWNTVNDIKWKDSMPTST